MATSNPNDAAAALAAQTYATSQQRADAGKKAMLDQMAAQGTYNNTIQYGAQQAAAPTAPEKAYAGDTMAPITTQTNQEQAMNQAATAAAAALAAHQVQQQQQAAQTYFDQVKAAVPIEQSRAQSQAAQIYQQLLDEREQRALALQQSQLSLQETRARIAAAQAGGGGAGGGLSVNQRIAAQNQALDLAIGSDPRLSQGSGNARTANRRGVLAHWIATTPGVTSDQITAHAKALGLDAKATQTAVDAANNYFNLYGQITQTAVPPVVWTPPQPKPKKTAKPKTSGGGGGSF